MTRKLPPTASVAEPGDGAKLHTPAAARNAGAITELVARVAPAEGRALEIASGTGQHIVALAAALPGLSWQPTDVAPERLRSIDAHVAEAGVGNVAPARHLDATEAGWPDRVGPQDLVVLVNLLHLISEAEAKAILAHTAQALAPGGVFVLYGPFRRDGALTSEGDRRFDAELRAADPNIGYKDSADIVSWLNASGLEPEDVVEMPANNRAFVARRPET